MVLLGNGNEISWVRSCLGTNQFGYEPVWVRTSLGTKSPDFDTPHSEVRVAGSYTDDIV